MCKKGIVTIPKSENTLLSCREKAELFKSYFALFFATKKNDADCAEWNVHRQQRTEAGDVWEDSKVP